LPDEHLLATTHEDLELYHPWQLDAPTAIALAIECEDVARAYHPDISNSDGATVNTHQGIQVLGKTLGFLQGYQTTRHSLSCSVIGQRDDEMQRNYWYSVGRHVNDLESPASIGKKAAERTLKRLGSRSLTTRVAPVLYAPEMAAGLLGALMSAISGGSLYRKTSFLLDSLETQILPDFIRIHEQPHLKRALGSSFFDSEGVATHSRDIVSAGVLKSYLLGSYSARKLAMQSTGNAGGVRNLTLAVGDDDFAALLTRLDTGLVVTELMGNGINRLTGDYSRGAAGFWVENGQIQYPVEEITIAGNLKQMFKNIVAVGNDVDTRGNTRTGSILISQMSIAGK
jgi:PmbA protein